MSINVSSTNMVPVESLLTGNNKKNSNTDFTEALVVKQDLQKSDIATDKVSLSSQSLAMAQANGSTPEERLNNYIQNGGNIHSTSQTYTFSEESLRKQAEESLAFSRKMGMTEDGSVEEIMNFIKSTGDPAWHADYAIELANNSYSERESSIGKFNRLTKDDQKYYAENIDSIYKNILSERGLTNNPDKRYHDLFIDLASSEQIHQEMNNRIKQDDKLVQIFNKIGKASVLA